MLTISAAVEFTVSIELIEGKAVSPLLMGIFYEDQSYTADDGFYAELISDSSDPDSLTVIRVPGN